jgi:hypothetical protein
VASAFPNDALGRTNDFEIMSLGDEGSSERRATVSSPNVRTQQGAPILFNVAWGSCKIITAAPEDARVQVGRQHCLIPSLFARGFHVFGSCHGACNLHLLCTHRNPLRMLGTMKMKQAMRMFHWTNFQTLNLTLRTSIKMRVLILTLARRLLQLLGMMDMIAAQWVNVNMRNMISDQP